MILAAAEYREFIRSYPYSPSAAYSQYQIAMTFYKKMLKPGRDPSKTIQALAEFKKVITDYPASDQAKTPRKRSRNARSDWPGTAPRSPSAITSAGPTGPRISRLTDVMNAYPNYTGLDQVYFYLGDCYFMTRQYDQAVPYFTKVVTDYPGRSLAKTATKRLAEIEKLKAAAKDAKDKKS